MAFIEEAVEKFKFETPDEIRLSVESPEIAKAMVEIEEKYKIELSPLLILVVVGDVLMTGASDYLENEYGVDEATAQTISKEFEEKIYKPLVERVTFLMPGTDKEMTLEQEKNYAENIFSKNLLVELEHDPIIIDAVNQRVFAILARDINFKKNLEQALHQNNEIATQNKIIIEGQPVPGTVSYWIKDFIGRYGGDAFDAVSLSGFLINSDNAKALNNAERNLVADILKVYTNVKFFPDSMPSDDEKTWQIIPFELQISEPKTKSVTKPAADNPEVTELKNLMLKYPAGSLERAAIEEELKKITS